MRTRQILCLMTLLTLGLIPIVNAQSNLKADGKEVPGLNAGAETFTFVFDLTKESTKDAYEPKGPMKMAVKKQKGFIPLNYQFDIYVKQGNDCTDNIEGKILFQAGDALESEKTWSELVKAGEPAKIEVMASLVYDKFNNLINKCELGGTDVMLEAALMTLNKSSVGIGKSGPAELVTISRFDIPVTKAMIGQLSSGSDEQTYQEFLSGNKAHRVKDEGLVQAIEEELNRLKKGKADIMTIHVQDISWQDDNQTTLRWYAHNIYQNEEMKCKFGYIYGEAIKNGSSYSMNYFNGEREEFITCDYAEKLRNR